MRNGWECITNHGRARGIGHSLRDAKFLERLEKMGVAWPAVGPDYGKPRME